MIKSRITTIAKKDSKGACCTPCKSMYQEYNKAGLLVSQVIYLPDGAIRNRVLCRYNRHGQLIEEVYFNKEDALLKRTDFFYDDRNRLLQTEITLSDETKIIKEHFYDAVENFEKVVINSELGEILGYRVIWYGKNHEPVAEVRSNANHRTEYKKFVSYDSDGRKVLEEIFGLDEVLQHKISYQYHQNGLLSHKTLYDGSGSTIRTEGYHYNDQLLLLEKTVVDSFKSMQGHTAYAYDCQGNLQSEKTYRNGQLMSSFQAVYDAQNMVVEEERISFVEPITHEIKKYMLEYW